MSFLSILKTVGSVAQKVTTVASNPAIVAIATATPIGPEYVAAVNTILALESMLPTSGNGAVKAAVSIPALQHIFPNASLDSITALNTDLVAAFNKFAAANTPG